MQNTSARNGVLLYLAIEDRQLAIWGDQGIHDKLGTTYWAQQVSSICSAFNKNNYKCDQILSSEGIWAVFYDDKPINLKTHNILVSYPGPKYKKVSFSNSGHAINLCKKLNVLFKTDKFSVVLLKAGDKIFPT